MTYFLRFTETPETDLKRSQSVHATDAGSIAEAVEWYGGDSEDYVIIDGCLVCQRIDGLCGFELDSDELEDAISEAKAGEWGIYETEKLAWAIFEGDHTGADLPDGDTFTPETIAFLS